jgi:hypothetical protein
MPVNEIGTIAARLALADAILEAVKESGLMKKARTSTARARKAAATRARNARAKAKAAGTAPATKKRGTKPKNPLTNVPDEAAA